MGPLLREQPPPPPKLAGWLGGTTRCSPGGLVVRSLRRNPGRVGWCRRGAEESEEVSEESVVARLIELAGKKAEGALVELESDLLRKSLKDSLVDNDSSAARVPSKM